MSVTGSTPLGSPGRAALHIGAIFVGWALFVVGWARVASRPWDAHELWVLIVASAVVLPSLTVLWIAHNLALYRSRGRRRAVASVEKRYDVDWAGRPVEADWASLQHADRVWIDVESGVKRFRSIAPVPVPFNVGAPDDTVGAPTAAPATSSPARHSGAPATPSSSGPSASHDSGSAS